MNTYNTSIDFTSLCNLKIMKVEAEDFLKLKNNTLESLTLVSNFVDPIKEKKNYGKNNINEIIKRSNYIIKNNK